MPHALTLNLPQFCSRNETRAGTLAGPELARVAADAVEVGAFRWQAVGSTVARSELPECAGRPLLTLRLAGSLRLPCARCLAPVEVAIDLERRYVGFDSEAEADAALLEDDRFDAVVASPAFDLGALIEDELLMALPATPRHAQCPPAALAALGLAVEEEGAAARTEPAENPFEVLRVLKKH